METHNFEIQKEFFGKKDAAVFEGLIQGLSQQEIADKIHRSRRTIEKNVLSIYEKLGVRNAAEAVHKAYLSGIIKILSLMICIAAGMFSSIDNDYLNVTDIDRETEQRRQKISRTVRVKFRSSAA